MSLRELEQAAARARIALSDLGAVRRNERQKRISAFIAELDEELGARFDDPLEEAEKVLAEAESVRDKAREDAALSGPLSRFVGVEVEEWRSGRWEIGELKRTCNRGVMEIWTAKSAAPVNFASWRKPEIGHLVVRLLKKDGAPSLRFEKQTEAWHWKTLDGKNVGRLGKEEG